MKSNNNTLATFSVKMSENIYISCDHLTVSKNRSVVIIAHGLASHKRKEAVPVMRDLLSSSGYNVICLDLFGHGESDGDFSDLTPQLGSDSINAVITYAREELNYDKIALLGESFGGTCSILHSVSTPPDFLLLKSPAVDFLEISPMTEPQIAEWKENKYLKIIDGFGEERDLGFCFYEGVKAVDLYELSKGITSQTLIMHGTTDEIVPLTQAEKLDECFPESTLIKYEDGLHELIHLEDGKKIVNDIHSFLTERGFN